jgi:hypothetical protein
MTVVGRPLDLDRLARALARAPVAALVGPRQCGKTTLARQLARRRQAVFFDLESPTDQRRLANPELVLGAEPRLVVLDEIQARPHLLAVLRVLADRTGRPGRFLVLGSASPSLVRGASESLAGRVEFVEMAGFCLRDVGRSSWERLWLRGGFPRAYLARSAADSVHWRDQFIRTFLERDIPQLGITIPSAAMRRFWTMLAHYHGQTWNSSELARSMGLSDKTVRSYLDILTGTFMVRQLQPWHANVAKRQVKAPRVYLRDSGLLHSLLELGTGDGVLAHPRVGASWEGFVIEQVLRLVSPASAYYWAVHGGADLDLFFVLDGRRVGVEVKFTESPVAARSMHTAIEDLGLAHIWVVHPGVHRYPIDDRITAWPVGQLEELPRAMRAHRGASEASERRGPK